MVITTITDGFGNQMFMFAHGYALSRRMNTTLVLDTTYLSTNTLRKYELGNLNVKFDKIYAIDAKWPYWCKVMIRKALHAAMLLHTKLITEKKNSTYDDMLIVRNQSYRLFGYWQSEKYFVEYKAEILGMLTANYPLPLSFVTLQKQIESCESVSVHVRRGDYIALGICLDKNYYIQAIRLIMDKVGTVQFFVFSDDMDYAKSIFGDIHADVHYVNYKAKNPTIEDFLLMKSCKHHIIANSSYSWWGAWANENQSKIVICPKRSNNNDFYPSDWIQI